MTFNRRLLRLNDLLREEISDLLRKETEDPALHTLISITEVRLSGDLQTARVYFSALGDDEETTKIFRALRKASRFFRRELAQRLNLRHTPLLDFQPDPSLARGARMLELLGELEGQSAAEGDAPRTG